MRAVTFLFLLPISSFQSHKRKTDRTLPKSSLSDIGKTLWQDSGQVSQVCTLIPEVESFIGELIGHIIGRLSCTPQLIHHSLTYGLLVRQKSWQNVAEPTRQHVHPLGFVCKPVLFTDFTAEPRGRYVVLVACTNNDTGSSNS